MHGVFVRMIRFLSCAVISLLIACNLPGQEVGTRISTVSRLRNVEVRIDEQRVLLFEAVESLVLLDGRIRQLAQNSVSSQSKADLQELKREISQLQSRVSELEAIPSRRTPNFDSRAAASLAQRLPTVQFAPSKAPKLAPKQTGSSLSGRYVSELVQNFEIEEDGDQLTVQRETESRQWVFRKRGSTPIYDGQGKPPKLLIAGKVTQTTATAMKVTGAGQLQLEAVIQGEQVSASQLPDFVLSLQRVN